MENEIVRNETKPSESTEAPESEKSFGDGILPIALSIFMPIMLIGVFYWFYAQDQKTFKESMLNITTVNDKQENSINSTTTVGQNNQGDIKELQERTLRLESNLKKLAELNNKLLISLNKSIKTSENSEKEFRKLTDQHQEVINNMSKDMKSDDKYYIIKKPVTPLPVKNTTTPPTAPAPTQSTVTVPTTPLPVKETGL